MLKRSSPPRTGFEYHFADSLRNMVLTLDESNTVTAHFVYSPFGEILEASGEADHRRQFNGKEHDAISGLRYYGARYYDPVTLRWNSGDPLLRFAPEVDLTNPQEQNIYQFALNNPLRFYDPDGLNTAGTLQSQIRGAPSTSGAASWSLNDHVVNFVAVGEGLWDPSQQIDYSVWVDLSVPTTATPAPPEGDWWDTIVSFFVSDDPFENMLMAISLIPGVGDTASDVLGLGYAIYQSDWVGAAISAAALTIPAVGAALIQKAIKQADNKPVRRIYEHNPKHRDQPYTDSRGRTVSRKPQGDCQGMLDCSVQKKPTSPARQGVEPSTGKKVEFRRHLVQEDLNEIRELFHGFVPE